MYRCPQSRLTLSKKYFEVLFWCFLYPQIFSVPRELQMPFFFFSFFFFSFISVSWRLITLQYCSCFCHTLTWISHAFIFHGLITFIIIQITNPLLRGPKCFPQILLSNFISKNLIMIFLSSHISEFLKLSTRLWHYFGQNDKFLMRNCILKSILAKKIRWVHGIVFVNVKTSHACSQSLTVI